MIVDKFHEINSFKQNEWFEKILSFNTQKRNQAVIVSEMGFHILFNNTYYGETWKKVRNRLKTKLFEEDIVEELF